VGASASFKADSAVGASASFEALVATRSLSPSPVSRAPVPFLHSLDEHELLLLSLLLSVESLRRRVAGDAIDASSDRQDYNREKVSIRNA